MCVKKYLQQILACSNCHVSISYCNYSATWMNPLVYPSSSAGFGQRGGGRGGRSRGLLLNRRLGIPGGGLQYFRFISWTESGSFKPVLLQFLWARCQEDEMLNCQTVKY